MRLQGKIAIVTGGASGFGAGIARKFVAEGARVMIADLNIDMANELAAELGDTVQTIQTNVARDADVAAMVQSTIDAFGQIDILINNVGGRLIDDPIESQSLEDWQRIIDLNLTSTFLCTKIIGGAMIDQGKGGRIINVASISGMIANRGIGGRSYETSKAAVIQFTRATAADWAQHGIAVNAICPGGFMTAPNQRWAKENPEVIAGFEEQIPMGKFGEPEDLGPLAVYLASDASRYMTGASLVIDGGYTLW